ncbi:hypothetical protein I4U23_015085 [Adineta vaga]|nr:hypothetical protein I4U23_015085 [Adineta vaga]
MNRFRPFFSGPKNEDVPECYNRVRYIRDSCKTLSDLWKSDKDFLNKSIDGDVTKTFKEFRASDCARAYYSPSGPTGSPSVLNSTIEDLVSIHDDQAKEKQSTIRQTMADLRDKYERAQRKYEAADANFKKFQNRSDRNSVPNYEERYRELEDNRSECDQDRMSARDIYATETYRVASEEHSISRDFFAQFIFEEQTFYDDIQQYLSKQIPRVQDRLNSDKFAPSFHCDLAKHCIKRIRQPIAYPIETCIHLLRGSENEEGLFRIAPAHGKQKKLVSELDLQLLNKHSKLNALGYDAHVAAGTLKQYLRELPDCLLTDELLSQWLEVLSLGTEEARIQRIGELIHQLPKVNYDNLCYLIRFLSDVAEHSSENKMTASNLGICIGCSLLYAKDQPSIPTMSNSYTQSSTIVELMIIHHKKFFPSNGKTDMPTRTPPDVIPTVFQTEKNSATVDNLIDIEPSDPSPPQFRKPPAPRPPSVRQPIIQTESAQSPRIHGDSTTSNKLSVEPITAPSSPGLHVLRRSHSRTASGDVELDRSIAPPPVPPPVRPRPSNYKKESDPSESTTNDLLFISPTSDDGVQLVKSTPDTHTRVANSNNHSGQTTNLRTSTHQQQPTPTSPEEITQF